MRRELSNDVPISTALRGIRNDFSIKTVPKCPTAYQFFTRNPGIHQSAVHVEQHGVAAKCHIVRITSQKSMCQSARERGSDRDSEHRLADSTESASERRAQHLQCGINSYATLYPLERGCCSRQKAGSG